MRCLSTMFLILLNLGLANNVAIKLKQKLKNMSEIFLFSEACRMREKLITSERNEEFELVETYLNHTLTLACHYCDENDDNVPKIWYTQSRFNNSNITEVELGMEDELSKNRVYMKPDHTLVINGTVEEDAALYFCYGPLGEDQEYKFNYLVDIVNTTEIKVTFGSMKDWTAFGRRVYTEMNKNFTSSNRSDYALLRSKGIHAEVVGRWQPWGSCDGCKKIRLRIADCRLQPSLNDRNITWIRSLNDSELFLMRSFETSCFSMSLRKFFPNISDDLATVGNFAISEPCYAPCKINSNDKSAPRYRNTVVLAEGDHFTLICPEATLKSEVVWEKNGVAISPNIRGGNIIVDSFSNLYIIYASTDEEANYTCYVDDVKMQDVFVIVRQQFVVTSEAFLRHLQYLGFIFLFSGIFYSAGMVLAWNRRHTFKKVDFSKIQEERFAKYLPNYDIDN